MATPAQHTLATRVSAVLCGGVLAGYVVRTLMQDVADVAADAERARVRAAEEVAASTAAAAAEAEAAAAAAPTRAAGWRSW